MARRLFEWLYCSATIIHSHVTLREWCRVVTIGALWPRTTHSELKTLCEGFEHRCTDPRHREGIKNHDSGTAMSCCTGHIFSDRPFSSEQLSQHPPIMRSWNEHEILGVTNLGTVEEQPLMQWRRATQGFDFLLEGPTFYTLKAIKPDTGSIQWTLAYVLPRR